MNNYGLTAAGFVPKSLQESRADIEAQLQTRLGDVDLSESSVLSNLSGIMANADADLWQALQAVYAGNTIQGASGVQLDNILAQNGLTRLPAAATVTDPNPVRDARGLVLYGLRLLGTPGTVVPAGTLLSRGGTTQAAMSLDAAVTIGSANNAQQVIYFSNTPAAGFWQLGLTAPSSQSILTKPIAYNADAQATYFGWGTLPTAGTYILQLGKLSTQALAYNASAAAVQAAVRALAGFADANVTGSMAGGFSVVWGPSYAPLLSATGAAAPVNFRHAVCALVHNVVDTDGSLPFTDVRVTAGTQNLTLYFGVFAPLDKNPSSAAQGIARCTVENSTLTNGPQVTSVTPQIQVTGSPSQATGTATATTSGPVAIKAGQLNTVNTPVSGLSGVTNDLDCLTGRDVETDADAVARLQAQQGASGSGSLGAIVNRVSSVNGVTQCVGFQNTSSAAQQQLLFASTPTSGSFALVLGDQTTPVLPYNTTAAALQAAIRELAGFATVVVTAYGTGFSFDFAGVRGGQALNPIAISQNTTGVALTQYYGRPPHSIEIVVEGGSTAAVAQAILATTPAGVSTYSNPSLRTTGSIAKASSALTVATAVGVEVGQNVEAAGVPIGTIVTGISQNVISLSAPATSDQSSTAVAFDYAPRVKDVAGNAISVAFSRPVPVLIYVVLDLITDRFLEPGNSASGLNAASEFDVSSVAAIQQNLLNLINSVSIGGQIIANGTNSLGGSFRNTRGIVSYDLAFGPTQNPTTRGNFQLQSNQSPVAESYTVQISYR